MNFYETKMGQDFFTHQLPALIGALQDIAAAPAQRRQTREMSAENNDILSALYHGNYEPEFWKVKKDDPFDSTVMQAENTLTTQISPEQKKLFDEYQAAFNARADNISERAFRAGVQIAVQMILAGCDIPNKKE